MLLFSIRCSVSRVMDIHSDSSPISLLFWKCHYSTTFFLPKELNVKRSDLDRSASSGVQRYVPVCSFPVWKAISRWIETGPSPKPELDASKRDAARRERRTALADALDEEEDGARSHYEQVSPGERFKSTIIVFPSSRTEMN